MFESLSLHAFGRQVSPSWCAQYQLYSAPYGNLYISAADHVLSNFLSSKAVMFWSSCCGNAAVNRGSGFVETLGTHAACYAVFIASYLYTTEYSILRRFVKLGPVVIAQNI
jgi:hypothetical protein